MPTANEMTNGVVKSPESEHVRPKHLGLRRRTAVIDHGCRFRLPKRGAYAADPQLCGSGLADGPTKHLSSESLRAPFEQFSVPDLRQAARCNDGGQPVQSFIFRVAHETIADTLAPKRSNPAPHGGRLARTCGRILLYAPAEHQRKEAWRSLAGPRFCGPANHRLRNPFQSGTLLRAFAP
jgi:hypothetical protein